MHLQIAVGNAKAGEVGSRTTIPKRVKPGQVPVTPEICQIIADEVEKRVQQRLIQGEPKTEVRRQLNFQDEDDDCEEAARKQKDLYNQRLEMMIQRDEKIRPNVTKRKKENWKNSSRNSWRKRPKKKNNRTSNVDGMKTR